MPIERLCPQIREQIRSQARIVWFTNKEYKKNPSPDTIANRFNQLIANLMLTSSLADFIILFMILGQQNLAKHNNKLFYTEAHGIKALAAVEIMGAICSSKDPTITTNSDIILLHLTNKIFQELDGTLNDDMTDLPESTIERILDAVERKDR